MELVLRDYQIDIVDKTRNALKDGFKAPLIVLPCGAGKTAVFAWMASQSQANGKIVWFLVHRQELLNQTEETFKKFDIPTDKILIGMVQTVANHLEKYPKPDIIVFDECFPGNTIINTQNGKKHLTMLDKSDIIASYNHQEKKIEYKKIIAFSKKAPDKIIKIILQNGNVIICTPNHPIFDKNKGEYVNAEKLTKESTVMQMCSMQNRNKMGNNDKKPKTKVSQNAGAKSLLFDFMFRTSNTRSEMQKREDEPRSQNEIIRENEIEQSNGERRKQNKNVKKIKRNWSLSKNQMWKWFWINSATTKFFNCLKRVRTLCRIANTNWLWKRKWSLSNLLQSGYSNPRINDCNRDRRWFSRPNNKTSSRYKENGIFNYIRVESVTVQKQTSDGTFGGLCPDGYVYNLEIEDNNNYFANDVLVHNCHFSAAKTWGKIIEAYPEAYRIGLTATPCRLDGKPLGEIYDKMIVGISTEELIETGKLSKYKYMSVPLINTKKMRTTAGDYNIADIEKEFKPTVYADVIKTYKQQADGKKSICYCPTIEISERTVEEFNQAGIHAVHFDGTTPKKQREQIISDFRAGEIKILCNVDLISVGFDVPDCECCILLRPTQSVALFIQQSMRALRPLPGKVAVILDHVANYQRHGLPDMARDWSLDKKIDKKGVQKVVETIIVTCENCYQVYEKTKGKTEPCPFCGFITEKQQRQMDYEKQIELQEITKTEKIKAWWQCKSMDELHEVAKQKGYKPGWAWLKGKELGFWKPKNWIAKEI